MDGIAGVTNLGRDSCSTTSALRILEKLTDIDPARLSPLERVLLITDGTLTEILEAYFLEPIELVKLSQRVLSSGALVPPFPAEPDESILERRINLRGGLSGRIYVHAESLLMVDRFSPQFRAELMNSEIPLGRLWHKFRLETYKELVSVNYRRAGGLGAHLGCPEGSHILARTYDVISSGKGLMRISEYFSGETQPSRV